MATFLIFSKNKKGNSLILPSVAWLFIMVLFSIFTSSLEDDTFYSNAGGIPQNPSSTSLWSNFFSTAPVFMGLPGWVLAVYGILISWGILLATSWGLAVVHGF